MENTTLKYFIGMCTLFSYSYCSDYFDTTSYDWNGNKGYQLTAASVAEGEKISIGKNVSVNFLIEKHVGSLRSMGVDAISCEPYNGDISGSMSILARGRSASGRTIDCESLWAFVDGNNIETQQNNCNYKISHSERFSVAFSENTQQPFRELDATSCDDYCVDFKNLNTIKASGRSQLGEYLNCMPIFDFLDDCTNKKNQIIFNNSPSSEIELLIFNPILGAGIGYLFNNTMIGLAIGSVVGIALNIPSLIYSAPSCKEQSL